MGLKRAKIDADGRLSVKRTFQRRFGLALCRYPIGGNKGHSPRAYCGTACALFGDIRRESDGVYLQLCNGEAWFDRLKIER